MLLYSNIYLHTSISQFLGDAYKQFYNIQNVIIKLWYIHNCIDSQQWTISLFLSQLLLCFR